MKKILLIACAVFFIMLPAFLHAYDGNSLDYGIVTGRIYTNAFFGMTVGIPERWQIQDSEASKLIIERGKKLFSGGNADLKTALDASQKSSVNLLTFMKHPSVPAASFNPSFVCLAEKVSQHPGITKGEDYLISVKKLMARSKTAYVFDEKISSVMIGGIPFAVITGRAASGRVTVTQHFYAAVRNGYALSFITSGSNEDEQAELDQIIAGITFIRRANER